MVWQKLILLVVVTFLFTLLASCTKKKPTEPEEECVIEWDKTYGLERFNKAYVVQQTVDGGYIIGGFTSDQSLDYGNAYLIKVDAQGSVEWEKTYDGYLARSLQQTNDGGYIIVGNKDWDVWVLKIDALGNHMWSRTYGGTSNEDGFSVKETPNGGYIIVGYTRSFGAGSNDIFIIRIDEQGDTLWSKTHGGDLCDIGYCVCVTSDSGFVITGETHSDHVCLLKTDSQGDTVWASVFGGDNHDEGQSVQQVTDGGYIVAGFTNSFGAGDHDMYLIKTDANGKLLWEETYGGERYDDAYSVMQTSDGGYIIGGYTSSFGKGYYSIYLIKTDAQGDTEWEKSIGGTGKDYGYSVQQTSDGGYIVAGSTGSYGEYIYDIWLLKIAP